MNFIRSIHQPRWPTFEWAFNEIKIYLTAAALSALAFFIVIWAVFIPRLLFSVALLATFAICFTIHEHFSSKRIRKLELEIEEIKKRHFNG